MGQSRTSIVLTGETSLHFKALFLESFPALAPTQSGSSQLPRGRARARASSLSVLQAEVQLLSGLLVNPDREVCVPSVFPAADLTQGRWSVLQTLQLLVSPLITLRGSGMFF